MRSVWAVAIVASVGVAWAADSPAPSEDDGALEAVGALGRELRGRLVPAPDVVVVGNSKVATDLDLPALEATITELGVGPAPRFAGLGVPGTQAPVWYAVASEHVFAAGARPRALLAYGTLAGALTTVLPQAPARTQLARLLGPGAPPVLARPFGAALTPELLDAYIRAGGNVCDPGRTTAPTLPAPVEPLGVEASFFAELAALAAKHEARFGFVRQPVAPSGNLDDAVPIEAERAAMAVVRRRGGAWIDLRAELRSELLYGDGVHMSEAGRAHATRALGKALVALGDWLVRKPPFPVDPSTGPARPAWTAAPEPPAGAWSAAGDCAATWSLPPSLAAIAPDALARAGFAGASPLRVQHWRRQVPLQAATGACREGWHEVGGVITATIAHDKQKGLKLGWVEGAEARGAAGAHGWWVAPGAPLRFEAGPGKVEIGGWSPPGVSLTVGERTVVLPGDRFTHLVQAEGTITVEATGGWALVTRAGPHLGAAPRTLDLRGAPVEVGSAPPLEPVVLRRVRGRTWSAAAAVEGLAELGADRVYAASGVGACSPVVAEGWQVSLAGGRLSAARGDCAEVEAAPMLAVALRADRTCKDGGGRWIYPGDRQVWRVPQVAAGPGPWSLELGAGAIGGAEGARMEVRVDDDAGSLLSTSFLASELRLRGKRWRLARPPGAGLRVTLVSPATAPWVLFGRAALVEGA